MSPVIIFFTSDILYQEKFSLYSIDMWITSDNIYQILFISLLYTGILLIVSLWYENIEIKGIHLAKYFFDRLHEQAILYHVPLVFKIRPSKSNNYGALCINSTNSKVEIILYRTNFIFPDNIQEEPRTLAHELGHFFSYKRGLFTQDYMEARKLYSKQKTLTPQQKRLILLEEIRAWSFGKQLLQDLHYPHIKKFNKEEKTCIREYCKSLKIKTPKKLDIYDFGKYNSPRSTSQLP